MKDLLLLVGLAVCVAAAHFLPLWPLGAILWLASAVLAVRRIAELLKQLFTKKE